MYLFNKLQKKLLKAIMLFVAALEAVPVEDWARNWPADRTIMLRMTSKQIKKIIDNMRLPVVVHLNMSFWNKSGNGAVNKNLEFVTRQLCVLATKYQITSLKLTCCNMNIQIERLNDVLAQCKSLTNLDLYNNSLGATGLKVLGQYSVLTDLKLGFNNIGAVGTESLIKVLTQCKSLRHLNLCNNNIGNDGLKNIEGVLDNYQCTSLRHLNLCCNQISTVNINKILFQITGLEHLDLSHNLIKTFNSDRILCPAHYALTNFNLSYNLIGTEGATNLARVLAQCTALSHLDLKYNHIGDAGIERLTGVLSQCSSLTCLNLKYNFPMMEQ
jgi:Ran GTPase-activating protein (RanGAP) involved in mRNA processing and transport